MTIDWSTLALQAVNVAVLIWLLARFFWKPLAAMIEARKAAAAQILDDAEATRKAAEQARAGIEATRAGFAQEREAILAKAAADAAALKAATLAATAKEVAAAEAAGRAALEKQRQIEERAWDERASHLAVAIAERLAGRLQGPAIRAAFLDWLAGEIQRLPEATREAVALPGVTLTAVTAKPMDEAEQAACRARIGTAFGTTPEIAFTVDPALVAGLELRGPHFVIANSWRADLDQILGELRHDA